MDGKGLLTYATGEVYKGDFKAGKQNGHGTLVGTKFGQKYEGYWLNDLRHGHGKESFENNATYNGQYF